METQESAPSTTRKGDRISISICVRVSCIDLAGEHFTDVVQTVNVSRSGCCLPLKCSLAPGQKIHLERIGSGEEAVGRVVGQTGIRPEHRLRLKYDHPCESLRPLLLEFPYIAVCHPPLLFRRVRKCKSEWGNLPPHEIDPKSRVTHRQQLVALP